MGNDSGLFELAGWNGLFSIFVTLGCVIIAWIVLQEVRWEKIARDPRGPKSPIAAAIGGDRIGASRLPIRIGLLELGRHA